MSWRIVPLLVVLAWLVIAMPDSQLSNSGPGVSTQHQSNHPFLDRGVGYVKGYGAAKLGVHICKVVSDNPSSEYTSGAFSGWVAGQSP
ncbi:MAG: hypothetical protein SGJ20_07875 [Planctomycetota bacterium]|nr:hypothetical protein [Planctomycetota bacterium]